MSSLDEKRERLITTLSESGGRLRVRNALNPILWLCGVTVVPCLVVLGWSKDPPFVITFVLIAVTATALLGFLFLLFFDRDRLQSEEYLLRHKTLSLIEEKGSQKAISEATVSAISQSEFLKLSDGKSEQEK